MKDNLLDRVENVIEEHIRPYLAGHGGDIKVNSIEDKTVRITLTGNCHGCPSAQITTEELVESTLKEHLGEDIEKVSLINQVSDDLLAFAKKLLNGDR